jgi:hypothetical protein
MRVKDIIEKWLQGQAKKMTLRAKSKRQGAFGSTLKTIQKTFSVILFSTFEWIWQAWEYGRGKTRKPGATYGSGQTLREAMERYARKNNIVPEKEIKSFAWLASQKIHKEGTKLFRGQDSRFPGKKSSGTINDFIDDKAFNGLLNDVETEIYRMV